MEKRKENKNLKRTIITFLIVLILLLIIIYIIIINRKVVIFDGNGADSGEMRSIVTFSKMDLEKNNFEKADHVFVGWKVYNDKTGKYSCEEGWFTEEEIKENNYTLKYLSTEEMTKKVNSIRGNNFIVTAQWQELAKVEKEENKVEEVKVEENVKTENIENLPFIATAKVEKMIDMYTNNKEKEKCTEHKYSVIFRKEATCEENGMIVEACEECKELKETVIPKKEHQYKEIIIKEPTVKEEGIKQYTCTECGDTKIEFIEKIKKTDLEILKENFEKENLIEIIGEDSENIPEDITSNDVTVKFKGDIYSREYPDGQYEMILDIIYNEKHYSMYVDPESAEILEIKEYEGHTEFKYGEDYISENEEMIIAVEENGNATTREKEGEPELVENYVFIYQNNLYILNNEEDGVRNFEWIGEIAEDGNSFELQIESEKEKFILKKIIDEEKAKIEAERQEEIRKAKGYYVSEKYDPETGRTNIVGFVTIPESYFAEEGSGFDGDYFMMITLGEKNSNIYTGQLGMLLSTLLGFHMKVGTYEFSTIDGTVKTLKNPIFHVNHYDINIGGESNDPDYRLFGYFSDENTLVIVEQNEVIYGDEKVNGYYYSGYTTLEPKETFDWGIEADNEYNNMPGTLKREDFPTEHMEFDKMYENKTISSDSNGLLKEYIAYKDDKLCIITEIYGYKFIESGMLDYRIDESYIQDDGIGNVVDHTGEKSILVTSPYNWIYDTKWTDKYIGYIDEDENIVISDELNGDGTIRTDGTYVRIK